MIPSRVETLTLPTEAGPLTAVAHFPEYAPAPVVVCCHGLLSSKDGRKFVAIGEKLCAAGLVVLRFDFCGCGQSAALGAESIVASRLRDLSSVLDYVREQPWTRRGMVCLLGSSLGGFIALQAAAGRTDEVRAVACWATPFDLTGVAGALDASPSLKASVPPGTRLGAPSSLSDLPAVPRVLIVHGRQDEVVPWKESLDLYEKVGDPSRLLLLERADHRLLDPACRELAIHATLNWFCEHLEFRL